LRFSLRQNHSWYCPVRADFFGSAAGGGAAQHCEPSGARRANTILWSEFEFVRKRSLFLKSNRK